MGPLDEILGAGRAALDLGDEVRHRSGEETTSHFCMGPSTVMAPEVVFLGTPIRALVA